MAGIFGIHKGAWGTPEFGLTEKIGDAFGLSRSREGGSQIRSTGSGVLSTPYRSDYYTPSYQAPTPTTNRPTNNAQVLGASTTAVPQKAAPAPSGFNPMDRNTDPGEGWFWDAADGWKQSGGQGTGQDLYAEIGGVFDELLGSLGGQQSAAEQRLGTARDTQKTGIEEQLGYGIENLNNQRGQVKTNQANTLADLAESMRTSSRNISNYLGSRGSGFSSATDQASFALQKLFGKERAGVMRQADSQMNDIATAENNLKASASQMMNDVDTWFNTQMSEVASQFDALRNNIGSMKANMRAQAVEALWNQANQLQAQRDSYAQAIQQNAMQRLQGLTDMRLALQQSASFNPQDIVYSEYGFNPAQSYTPDEYMFNPLAMARRRQEDTI